MGGIYSRKIDCKGIEAVELAYGGYYALVAPTVGSNVLRFRDNGKGMEILRYKEDASIAEIVNAPFLWGLPMLYLQNRFDGGTLKTSDTVYSLPVNEEEMNNHIHGFIHARVHKVRDMGANGERAFVTTTYSYDENDFFYNCFPVKFLLETTAELSDGGLRLTVTYKNLSDKMMPISIAAHTAFSVPFVDGGKQEDARLELPISERVIADESRWLPTGEFAELNDYDLEYKSGVKCPVLQDINNNHYRAAKTKLDGKDFNGCILTDAFSGKKVCYETDEKFKFWIVWNQGGFNGYFCPEPLTAMINAPNLALPHEKTGYCEIKPGGVYSDYQRIFTKNP